MPDRHYVGEVGTEIIVDCGDDVSGALYCKLKVVKPNGDKVEWDCNVYQTNYLRHITVATDFSEAGTYILNAYVKLDNGWEGHGNTCVFTIYKVGE